MLRLNSTTPLRILPLDSDQLRRHPLAAVTFVGGPLDGVTRDQDDSVVNVLDDRRLGRIVLVSYRCDMATGTARVVAEADC